MKKLILSLATLFYSITAFTQVAWVEPDPTIATEKITIYVDLNKLDLSLEHNALLLANPGPMYIWTWKPYEWPVGTPKTNGLGEKPWQNSNDLLQMTPAPEKGEKVWKYEMVPTEFYEVPASQVYASGIALIVKPKNGGGYGDPDIKTNDLSIPINPPKTDKGALYSFPSVLLEDEITTIVYNNAAEQKPSMQNLPSTTKLYMHLKATAKDSATGVVTTYEPYKLLQVLNKPHLLLQYTSPNTWTYGNIIQDYFNFPPTAIPIDMEMRIVKEGWTSDDDTGGNFGKVPLVKFGCK